MKKTMSRLSRKRPAATILARAGAARNTRNVTARSLVAPCNIKQYGHRAFQGDGARRDFDPGGGAPKAWDRPRLRIGVGTGWRQDGYPPRGHLLVRVHPSSIV